MKNFIIRFIFLFISTLAFPQHYVLDSIIPTLGHLIDFEKNQFYLADKSPYFQRFFLKFDSIYKGKEEKLHIFHIGGSHIQADIYSNKMRTYLQNSGETMQAQRGFVFPYHLAHTNNPINYRIEANKEKWTGYRCSIKKDSIAWGLAGITAAFRDKIDTIYLKSNHKNYTKKPYTFSRLRLFYNTWKNDYNLRFLDSTLVDKDSLDSKIMYRDYFLNRDVDSVAIEIKLKDTTLVNPEFLFMGVEFMNDNPGIEYTSIGVNGASFKYFNRSAFLETQLALYKPDLFIISIGTNDAYVPASYFDSQEFKEYYDAFIRMIRRINPNCAILLTVPNDDYYKRRKPNPNTAKQKYIITELAKKHQLAVWDFYSIMGGYGSSNKWYKSELMPRDRIHFTMLGYSVKGDLFLNAFIKAWALVTNQNALELLNHFKNLEVLGE